MGAEVMRHTARAGAALFTTTPCTTTCLPAGCRWVLGWPRPLPSPRWQTPALLCPLSWRLPPQQRKRAARLRRRLPGGGRRRGAPLSPPPGGGSQAAARRTASWTGAWRQRRRCRWLRLPAAAAAALAGWLAAAVPREAPWPRGAPLRRPPGERQSRLGSPSAQASSREPTAAGSAGRKRRRASREQWVGVG